MTVQFPQDEVPQDGSAGVAAEVLTDGAVPDCRRQKLARWAVGAGLAGAAGLTALTLATVGGPTAAPTVAAVPTDAFTTPVGVATAGGLVPSVEPPVATAANAAVPAQ